MRISDEQFYLIIIFNVHKIKYRFIIPLAVMKIYINILFKI